jgi:hypothetical protein
MFPLLEKENVGNLSHSEQPNITDKVTAKDVITYKEVYGDNNPCSTVCFSLGILMVPSLD